MYLQRCSHLSASMSRTRTFLFELYNRRRPGTADRPRIERQLLQVTRRIYYLKRSIVAIINPIPVFLWRIIYYINSVFIGPSFGGVNSRLYNSSTNTTYQEDDEDSPASWNVECHTCDPHVLRSLSIPVVSDGGQQQHARTSSDKMVELRARAYRS